MPIASTLNSKTSRSTVSCSIRFADDVRMSGPVCDIGCGPAHIARYLFDRGVNVFGLDLSAGMLNEAKRLNPHIDFIQGSMLALGLGSATLGGIAAFYS